MTADEVSTDTARRQAEVLLPVRYQPGVVGESRRVVHRAVRMPGGRLFVGLCGEPLAGGVVELGVSGAPCLRCVSVGSFGLSPVRSAVA